MQGNVARLMRNLTHLLIIRDIIYWIINRINHILRCDDVFQLSSNTIGNHSCILPFGLKHEVLFLVHWLYLVIIENDCLCKNSLA